MGWSKLLTKDNAITTGEIIGGFIPGISEQLMSKMLFRVLKIKTLHKLE